MIGSNNNLATEELNIKQQKQAVQYLQYRAADISSLLTFGNVAGVSAIPI
jgi:hypothetical protein